METFKKGFNDYAQDLKMPWFPGATSYCIYRYNKYPKNTRMLEHCDHIHSIFDGTRKGVPILTGLVFLNEGFVGGDLVLFKDKKIETNTGDLMIFPSCFLYPHRVDKVLEGVRFSVVSWAW
jgi:predicted 2-oxoglutarate/Fe(II)-dependent dioxygenase YbiX